MRGRDAMCLRFLLLLLPGLVTLTATADDIRPLYIEIDESDQFQYHIAVKKPPRIPESNRPVVKLPDYCSQTAPNPLTRTIRHQQIWQCQQDLSGAALEIMYPRFEVANSTVIKVQFASGESQTVALASGERRWRLPHREETATVAAQYTWLGIEHIWIGYDHLLFVLCLIWIAGSWQRILVTITGFTLAHSVTLAMSALDLVRLAVPPVEALIALSVLFLATEIVRDRRDTLTWRHPIAVSSSFGLLHGLGFAAVLKEIGLPQTEMVTGLLFFNVGVEIGQIAFAAAVIASMRLVTVAAAAMPAFRMTSRQVLGYLVGCTSAYWLVERTAGFLV